MGKIIELDGFSGQIGGAPIGENRFSVSLKADKNIDLAFNGDPAVIIEMLYQVMGAGYEHVTKSMITAVLIFADQKKIPLDQLVKHSYIQTGKIITP